MGRLILVSQVSSIAILINRVAGVVIAAVTVATVPTKGEECVTLPIIGRAAKGESTVTRGSSQSTGAANSGRVSSFYIY